MSKIVKTLLFLCLLSTSALTQAITLTIGVTEFYPPFVMQTANDQLFGFDISLAQRLCKILHVNCKYKPMAFEKLLPSVLLGEVDMAMSALTITHARMEMMHFSLPYMLSQGRFLVNRETKIKSFSKDFLKNKTIGVQLGTIFDEYLLSLNIKGYKLIYYKDESEQVSALIKKKVDIVALDNPNAIWWSLNTTHQTKVVGKPFKIGEGIGIAVAEKNIPYIKNINQAIVQWQKDGSFHKAYNMYFNPLHVH